MSRLADPYAAPTQASAQSAGDLEVPQVDSQNGAKKAIPGLSLELNMKGPGRVLDSSLPVSGQFFFVFSQPKTKRERRSPALQPSPTEWSYPS